MGAFRRHPVTATLLVILLVALAGVGALLGGSTLARFSDTEAGTTSKAGAATVVLGGQRTGQAVSILDVATSKTFDFSIVYRGTIPATLQFLLPSGATASQCVRSSSGAYVEPGGLLARTLSVQFGTQAAVPYCSLLDGVPRTIATNVLPGTTTTVRLTVTVGGLAVVGRNESAPFAIRATSGFTDTVTGTIRITTTGLFPSSSTPVPAPTTTTSATGPTALSARSAPRTVAAVPVPSECTDAGMTTFAESVQLTAAAPRFVAAEDRPGAAGPFLVIGTDADDTITGSGAGDCIVGAGGADTVDGAGGGDVLLAGDGADVVVGAAGDDVLRGGAGVDRLTGGDGADLIDGGDDGALCDITPQDKPASACAAPAGTTTVPPTTAAPTTTVGPTPPPVTPSAAPAGERHDTPAERRGTPGGPRGADHDDPGGEPRGDRRRGRHGGCRGGGCDRGHDRGRRRGGQPRGPARGLSGTRPGTGRDDDSAAHRPARPHRVGSAPPRVGGRAQCARTPRRV